MHIAKGTFNHYFKSKEKVMNAVVDRCIKHEIAAAKAIAEAPGLTAHEKMFRLITSSNRDMAQKDRLMAEAHQVNNAEMHQKSMVASVLRLTPVMADIVKQGVREGTFTTEYPKESVEFLLDGMIFPCQPAELLEKTKAFSAIKEILLGVEKGSFHYVHAPYEEMLRRKGGGR